MQRHTLHIVLILLLALALTSCKEKKEGAGIQPFSAAYLENENQTSNQPLESISGLTTQTQSIEQSRQTAITNAVETASGSVVSIMATERVERRDTPRDEFFRHFFGFEPQRENTNMGSGFIISEDGLVVTNQHVIGTNPTEIMISTIYGEVYEAELIGSDALSDIALLRIQSENNKAFPFISFSDSDEILVGEWVIALGNPFGLFEDGQPTVTVGVVSAKNRDFNPDPSNPRVYTGMIQTDAAINRGNSGGPLLNSNGEVIGINTFIYTGGTSAGFVGLGFAIPSNRIDRIITQLLSGGSVMLDFDPGMEFTSMTEQLVYRYRLPYVQGLLVTSVNKDGPAFDCGILPGDVILKIGEERVVSKTHAQAMLREYREGDKLPIKLIRDNQQYKTEMHLRKKIKYEE